MRLFNVQDSCRPMWVLAKSYSEAIDKWKEKISEENKEDCPTRHDVEDPSGVSLVCDEDEVIL